MQSIVVSALLSLNATVALITPIPANEIISATPEEVPQVIEFYAKAAELEPLQIKNLKDIAYCESRNRQFSNDGVLYSHTNDVGIFQINEWYHKETAQSLGLDIGKLVDNVIYGIHLYTKEGNTPWRASLPCWSKRWFIE